jgi:hypothetical protein
MTYLQNLSGVFFGKDDAASESQQGFLGQIFLKTSFYDRVNSG